ncbi:hypothetical protein B0H65DRAFT_396000, partial [Neurospora tetraspora]
PTKGSKAIDKDGFYRTGLVSWPKTPLEFPEDSDSDVKPLNSDFAFPLPFQTNPAILTHVQKSPTPQYKHNGESKPDCQLILTIDVYPDFKKHPVTLTEELEERDDSEDEDDPEASTNKARLQEWKRSRKESRLINDMIFHITRLIEKLPIYKATPGAEDLKSDKHLTMVNIQELERGLSRISQAEALGVKSHWGFQSPLPGDREGERVSTRYLHQEMIPRERVEELRGLN